MAVSIRTIQSKRDLRNFILLPERIHAGHANWMPPLYLDERAYYNPAKNKAFSYCDTALWLAERNGKPAGRIMGIIHHPYNAKSGAKTVRFAHFDCFDDAEAVHALIGAVEQWGRSKGMNEAVGPFGFSDKDPEGFMIEGFDKLPILVTACNLPYMPQYLEKEGYQKKVDCLDFMINLEEGIPEFYPRIYERVRRNNTLEVLEFRRTKELKPFILPVFQLVNRTYQDIYGFVPMDEQEMREMARRYLPILDPRFVKIIMNGPDTAIAFIIGLPNMTPGIQRAGGRLLPFGFLHILRAAKTAKQLDLMLGAIDPGFRGRGLDILMGWKMIGSVRAARMTRMETHLVLETNERMRAEYEKMGAHLHKIFRIYRKNL